MGIINFSKTVKSKSYLAISLLGSSYKLNIKYVKSSSIDLVRQNQPLRALAVGEMKAALRIDQDVFFFQNIEFFVGKTIPERADFRGPPFLSV